MLNFVVTYGWEAICDFRVVTIENLYMYSQHHIIPSHSFIVLSLQMYLHNFELRSKTNNCNLLNLTFTIYKRAGAWKSLRKLETMVKM